MVKPRKIDFGDMEGRTVLTCSTCINDSLFDSWSLSWAQPIEDQIEYIRTDLTIDSNKQTEIQKWVDNKFEEGKMGWLGVFQDLETVLDYSNTYLAHVDNKEIMKIVFSESEARSFMEEFQPQSDKEGLGGIYQNLKLLIEANEVKEYEESIGNDLIGVEYGGGGFHSFHCHDLSRDFKENFGIELNDYGLIDRPDNFQILIDYMNDEENGFEPVPWFLVEIIKINEELLDSMNNRL